MEIKQSEFIISAVKPAQYPTDNRVEYAFVGRSNVGKSSLINTITNRRKLVKVSGTPGKTRLINFFLINDSFYFVDLPGYGYAKVSKTEQAKWGKMMEDYLVRRPQLQKVALLVDCRRKPTKDDLLMYGWIKHFGYEVVIVATKKDKLNRAELVKNNKLIRETLQLEPSEAIINISSLKKIGVKELLGNMFNDGSEDEPLTSNGNPIL
ncbi:ribosome biogenesis GTP-binding protein YihA/YsxC [Clostridium estertheticum]|uniref:Probable GTP-binding protein EngB n=1 Tax=Clostridium estertheticum subsp. estertheticum TaxID=1552 RepID=A0A1J0GL30_9CLOT|nr:ribosome biogenesis GTP-binding protein YihA/YsxC [Clostridium estertheticum]APC42027.1 YihA family ribosome biogenesis GTP-binding protein [Clostridium estertheticum subsp. estertheticum]MBU3184034.1 ribosome biogenesis GTP-binding protein YihA/YsxC [Clostridium estertheticum]MBZ9616064.1 ribosome biogenesis GTP-binding protein YihA/YsxC [Clostridium estertheticum subsp. laramiense]MCB2339487.1 ribosome biogenesis GTP-binding protein YihA/YsxC [Clostridium estertheticum]WAG75926.1 ribosome